MNTSRLRSQAGMTLIEILIVLVIIGGLMTVLGQNVIAGKEKASVREARIQLSELSKQLEMYSTDCKSYPSTEQGLHALLEAPADCKTWGPEPYVKPNMLKDPWGGDIVYERDGGSYNLKSLGRDKKEGGTGYDADISTKD
jgi:general secretion pathway protein G